MSKPNTETYLNLDIRWLRKQARPGSRGTVRWSTNGHETGAIDYQMEKNSVILKYFYRGEPVTEVISFSWTRCNYGMRPWFVCPGCKKRVAILYSGGKYFLCRHCYDLCYPCQQEGYPGRLARKASKLYALIGNGFKRPKYMRRKKFKRLQDEHFRLEMLIEDYAMPRLLKGGKKSR